MYNEMDLSQQSTSPIIGDILSDQGTDALTNDAQDWSSLSTGTLEEILTSVSSKLANDGKGAYFVVDSGSDSSMPKVVVYSSLNSPLNTPVYGNLVLQSLLQNHLGTETDVKLNFAVKPYVVAPSV